MVFFCSLVDIIEYTYQCSRGGWTQWHAPSHVSLYKSPTQNREKSEEMFIFFISTELPHGKGQVPIHWIIAISAFTFLKHWDQNYGTFFTAIASSLVRPDQLIFVLLGFVCQFFFPFSRKVLTRMRNWRPCTRHNVRWCWERGAKCSPVYPHPEWAPMSPFKDFLCSTTHHVHRSSTCSWTGLLCKWATWLLISDIFFAAYVLYASVCMYGIIKLQ